MAVFSINALIQARHRRRHQLAGGARLVADPHRQLPCANHALHRNRAQAEQTYDVGNEAASSHLVHVLHGLAKLGIGAGKVGDGDVGHDRVIAALARSVKASATSTCESCEVRSASGHEPLRYSAPVPATPSFRVLCCLLTLAAAAGAAVVRPAAAGAAETAKAAIPAGIQAALADESRSAQDRERDGRENPAAIVAFGDVGRSMRIADIAAHDGYLTHVLALSVQPHGKVYANNDPVLTSEADAKSWAKRLEEPATADIARLANPLSHPLPPYATRLAGVFAIGAYHQAVRAGIDRKQMNQTLFDALGVGAFYIVADARAADGEDAAAAAAHCRVSPRFVREEIEAAGFRFVEESGALAIMGDAPTSDACNADSPHDRFLMKSSRQY
jgi:predicted methyltransferase